MSKSDKVLAWLAFLVVGGMIGSGVWLDVSSLEAQQQRFATRTLASVVSTGDIKTGGFYYMTAGDATLMYQVSGAGCGWAVGMNGPNVQYFQMNTNGVVCAPRGFISAKRASTPTAADFPIGANCFYLWESNNTAYISIYDGGAVTTKQLAP